MGQNYEHVSFRFQGRVKFNMSYGFFVAHFLWATVLFPHFPVADLQRNHAREDRYPCIIMSNNENQKFTALFSLLKQLRLQDRKKKVVLKSLASFRPKRDIHHKLKPGFMVSLLPLRVFNGEVCEWYVLFLKPNLMSTCK